MLSTIIVLYGEGNWYEQENSLWAVQKDRGKVKLLRPAPRVNPEHVLVVVELLEGCICLTNYTDPQEKATTL